tara:strand:- start:130 stop:399 length:270 start_codon:yes stop_codon:yes gene_type:complete
MVEQVVNRLIQLTLLMQAEVVEPQLLEALRLCLKVVMVEQEQQQVLMHHRLQELEAVVVELIDVVTQVQQVQEREEQAVEDQVHVVLEL